MSQLSAWALFLGEEGPPSPPSLKAVQLAREDAAAARESAAEMSDRVDLLQAMLAIMEREISLRQNQLDLTTEMLRATETEVRRVVGGALCPLQCLFPTRARACVRNGADRSLPLLIRVCSRPPVAHSSTVRMSS